MQPADTAFVRVALRSAAHLNGLSQLPQRLRDAVASSYRRLPL